LEDQFQHRTSLKKIIWDPIEEPRRIQYTGDGKAAEFTARDAK